MKDNMVYLSWMFSAALFSLGLLVVIKNKQLAAELKDRVCSGWGKIINVEPICRGNWYVNTLRLGIIIGGIGIILVALAMFTGTIG